MKTMTIAAVAGCVLAAAFHTEARAQARTGAGAYGETSAIMEALIADVEQVEAKMVGLAEAIPEASWGWRPAEGVRSVGEVMLHVAADNYFIPAFTGAPAPPSTGITSSYASVQAYETRPLGKAETLSELRASFEHLKTVMRAVDEPALAENLTIFGMEMTGLRLWVLSTTHLHEHLGQSIAYARSNGVVPPWSRRDD